MSTSATEGSAFEAAHAFWEGMQDQSIHEEWGFGVTVIFQGQPLVVKTFTDMPSAIALLQEYASYGPGVEIHLVVERV